MRYLLIILISLWAVTLTAQQNVTKDFFTVFFITRHAEKSLTDPGSDPGLDPAGQKRAEGLAKLLQTSGVQAVYATATRRAQLTGKPLADSLHLHINTYGMDVQKEITQWRRKHANQKILIVGHSNTVPEILNILTGKTTYHPAEVYGALYMVIFSGSSTGKVVELQY